MKYNCLNCHKECKLDSYRKLNKYCSNQCQIDFQNKIKVDNWLKTGVVSRNGTPNWLKNYILKEQNNKCKECKNDTWMGKPLVLDLEHIDGNFRNNKRENLCCLCPNCHSMTPTYKAKNRGNGRTLRKV